MTRHSFHPLGLAALLLLLLSACGKAPTAVEEVRPVRYVIAGAGAEQAGDSYSGEIRARHETSLAFRVGGKVIEKRVNSGERVKKGQILARLDVADYALDLSAKQAALAAAQSDLTQQQLNLKRYRELLNKQFISQAQVDNQQNTVNAARARVEQASAQLSASHNQSRYTTLSADADGVINQMLAEPGLVVAAGQPVARLAQDGSREVAIQVPENALDKFRHTSQFQIRLWSGGKSYAGTLRELAADADPATRTYPARIALTQPDADVKLGMTANVILPDNRQPQWLRLPLTALLDQQGRHYVWRIDARTSRVSRCPVTVQSLSNDSVLIAGGIHRGDRIVSAGVHLLHDQQRVTLLKP